MRSRSSSLFALLAAAGIAAAQTPPPAASEEPPGALASVVTNSVTGAPILRAHVLLRSLAGPRPNLQPYGALTDAEGKFSIASMPPGTYSLAMERAGFVMPLSPGGGTGGQVRLAPGEKKTGLKLQLIPGGAISGRVTDAGGEPAEDVPVTLEGGTGGTQTGTTDREGRFRIGGLRPGRYRVRASPPNQPFPPEIRTDGTVEVHYAATWYPSALAERGATPISVPAGGEVENVEIRLVRTPMVRVSGTVTGRRTCSFRFDRAPTRGAETT